MNMLNIKKTLGTAVFALSSIAATAIIPATSVIGTSVAMTGLMTISSPAQASPGEFCNVYPSIAYGAKSHGVFFKAKKRRAVRKAKRAWKSKWGNIDKAKDVRIECGSNKIGGLVCAVIGRRCGV